ncbi:MAG: prolyl oligopeptidase family serine peptidase [Phototrophicales bacterium]
MVAKQSKTYGTWDSPISPAMVASGIRLNDVQWADEDTLVWVESRAKRGVLVVQTGVDAPRDLTGEDISVKGGVGYGGGEFTVRDGIIYFCASDGRLYRQAIDGGIPHPIIPQFGAVASPTVTHDNRWIAYVHTYENKDGLALVDVNGAMWSQKLIFGTDFVMQPVWHPSRQYLAYIAWHHPNMPWDQTQLHLATMDFDHAGMPYVTDLTVIAAGAAVFQPAFSPDGRYLTYISDISGYGQLYLYDLETRQTRQLTDTEAEHGTPAWLQGMRMYGWSQDGIYFLRNKNGFFSLHFHDLEEVHTLDTGEYTYMEQIAVSPAGKVAMIASSYATPPRIVTLDGLRVHRRSQLENIYPMELSTVQAIEWTGHDGEAVHGMYYPPNNSRFTMDGAPPLIVIVHGGPTSQSVAEYSPDAQFFATRGYAVLMVNHRGSTGYGRAYMEKLRGQWGYYDVEDSVSGAQHLVQQGLVDKNKIVIMGGSAGGYTVLQALVTKPGFFKAGVCRYGVANLFMLVQDTHKFEERYLDSLVGELPAASELYRERSPMFHADKIQDALIIFQGTEDTIVPQNQSEVMVKTLRSKGVSVAYHVYEGEGHGFRKPETLRHYYEAILDFLNQHVIYSQ